MTPFDTPLDPALLVRTVVLFAVLILGIVTTGVGLRGIVVKRSGGDRGSSETQNQTELQFSVAHFVHLLLRNNPTDLVLVVFGNLVAFGALWVATSGSFLPLSTMPPLSTPSLNITPKDSPNPNTILVPPDADHNLPGFQSPTESVPPRFILIRDAVGRWVIVLQGNLAREIPFGLARQLPIRGLLLLGILYVLVRLFSIIFFQTRRRLYRPHGLLCSLPSVVRA